MSFGGVVAAQVCHEDARCRAAANLDGTGSMAGLGLMVVNFGKLLLPGSDGTDVQQAGRRDHA
jgi:hypothetical protein